MSKLILLFLLFFGIYIVCIPGVNGLCNICQTNGAACVNLTSYYLCFDREVPDTTQLFTCPTDLQCTDLPNICFQASTRPASCGDISSCGLCNSNQVFACTSRTTFTFCFGALIPSDVHGFCPPDTICDATTQDICIPEIELTANSVVCDRDATI